MKNRILDHFGFKVMSLVLAIIIWIIVANVDDYKTTKQISGIEIDFINGDAVTEKNKVYEVPDGTTIDIVVKGKRSVVEGLSSDDFRAIADLSKMSVTDAVTVEVTAISSSVAKELTISYTNNAIVIAVENKISKQLPINVRTNSEVADGFAVRSRTATPNLITVEGAESVVDNIEEVVAYIDVGGANHSLTAYANPVFLDKAGEVIDASKFEYDVEEVEVSVEILQTKELAIRIDTAGEPKKDYAIASVDYQPTSIVVVGSASDLAKVDEISVDDIDVTNCDQDLETSVDISSYLPDGIALVDDNSEIMVKVIIEKVEEKILTLDTEDINIVGKEDGYSYEYKEANSYTLTVRGLKDNLDNLKITNLIPSIDVTGYGPGIYTFTVNLREISGIQITDSITVELEIAENE